MGVVMHDLGQIVGGQIMVMVGLFLFIEGIKNGLMPLGTKIGNGIPEAVPPWALYVITFITGIIGMTSAVGEEIGVERRCGRREKRGRRGERDL